MNAFSRRSIKLLAGVLLLCSSVFGQNGGLRFTLTDLGTFGAEWSEAWAINDQGVIVGTLGTGYPYTSGGTSCFMRQSNGSTITFDGKTVPPRCEALAIDNKLNVAGRMQVQLKGSGSLSRAFYLAGGQTLTILNPPAGYNVSWGYGVYGGTVVGGVGTTSIWQYCDTCRPVFSGLQTAVQWDANTGQVTTIVSGRNDYGNFATGVNRRGEIVGRVYYPGKSVGPHPWLWRNGVFINLVEPPNSQGGNYAQPNAINDTGLIVGGGSIEDPTHYGICVLLWNSLAPWNSPALGSDCTGDRSGKAISSDSWVVGYSDFGYLGNPFLSVPDPSCSLTSLSSLLDASGAGWTLWTANGINRFHQIVGAGVSPRDGQMHAILLTPNALPLCYAT